MSGENTNNTYTNVSDLPTMTEITSPAYVPVEDENKDGKKVDLNKFYTKTQADAAFVSSTGYVATDNNYTTDEKTKLAGIEAGAQANVKPDWDAEAGSDAEILNKPVIPAKGYTRRTITVESNEDGGRIFNFNVNDRESLTVNLNPQYSFSSTVHIHLSDDCDDAIILLNAPQGHEADSVECYRGDTRLTSIRQLVPKLSDIRYLLCSTKEDGSEIALPTDWSDVAFASGDVSQFNGYKILYNVDIGNNAVTKMLVRIVADYAFMYPVEFKEW